MRSESGFQVSCSNASPYPVQTRSVGTIAASTNCCLRTSAALLQHLALSVHCCCDVVSRAIRTELKLRKSTGLLAPTSDLQQQRSSIMMDPSGYPAARRQRCSHALIPSRQPGSVCTSTWSTPCVVTYRQPPYACSAAAASPRCCVLYLRAKSAR